MAEYTKAPERFVFLGVADFPPDALPPSKYPYVRNIRSYVEGEIRPRDGTVVRQTVSGAVHSLARLNDPTTFNGGVDALRIIGAGTDLYAGLPSDGTPPVLDSGYSGEPLTILTAQPPNSPRPWAYVADSTQFRKFATNVGPYPVGTAQPSAPTSEPSSQIQALKKSQYDIQTSATWGAAGTVATVPTTTGERVNTTISQILYDEGATGYCSIVPVDPVNITVGTLLTIGTIPGDFDNEIVTEITIPVADTTVESIIYDSGVSGLCTIQPAGSLGTGQLDAPPLEAYRRRASPEQQQVNVSGKVGTPFLPVEPSASIPTRRIRQVDFPVNCIIQLGAEIVRILSIAVGPDGSVSFRCRTSGTISAGDAIVGLPAFRLYLPNTRVPGDQILRLQLENILTYPEPAEGEKAKMTGGIEAAFTMTLAQFSDGTAVLPDDEIHIAVNVDRLQEVVSVRVYIDVDPTTNDFLQNYFFHEWRAADIVTAVQSINAQNVQPLVDVRKTVVTNQQLEQTSGLYRVDPRTGRRVPRRDLPLGFVANPPKQAKQPVSLSAIATQLALGNNQWVDLRVKLKEMVHIGTDPTQTLADAKAFEVLIAAEGPQTDTTPEPLTVKYSDLQIYGGGSPDVGEVGDPYVHAYRYRSTETGAISNPSPAVRGGLIPRRQNIDLVATPSTDPQIDLIDWFRLGGALTAYTYVGTAPNSADPFEDRYADTSLDGGEILAYDNFQPWPLQDLPRSGTAKVAGTAVQWLSGDVFNEAWAPGSVIIVNGRTTLLYSSPSGDVLQVVDSVGASDSVEFSLPGPTLLSQPLPHVWGDYLGWFFACGDQTNPGTLYFSFPNNLEATSDANSVVVTTPSEPLQGGGIFNTFPFVGSTEQFYAIIVQPNDPVNPVRAIRTPCGRGFWTPWAFCVGPEGVWFLAADGICLTAGGSPADIITSPELRNLFPKDGVPGETVNGFAPPDMEAREDLRLSYVSGWLYFDYLDTDGNGHTLVYDTIGKRFYNDDSERTNFTLRLQEPGQTVYDQIIGGANGEVLQYDPDALLDEDDDINWAVYTRWADGGAPRLQKQWGDVGLSLDPAADPAGVTVQPIAADGSTTPALTTVGAGVSGRQTFIVGLPAGFLADNLGLQITGAQTASSVGRPKLYWWEPSFIPKADDISRRVTDWTNENYVGAKFVQGVLIRANTYGQDKLVNVQSAEASGPVTKLTLTLNHNGESQVAYPLSPAGWTPFVAELVRLAGADDVSWQLLDYKFIWEPAPETATQWETQFTSAEWPGYGSVRDMVIGYEATAPITLLFTYDDRTQTYIIPANGGNYTRYYFPFCPNKAKAVKFRWTTAEPARIYKRDLTVRTQGWGLPNGYATQSLFGGPSRADGAAI